MEERTVFKGRSAGSYCRPGIGAAFVFFKFVMVEIFVYFGKGLFSGCFFPSAFHVVVISKDALGEGGMHIQTVFPKDFSSFVAVFEICPALLFFQKSVQDSGHFLYYRNNNFF